MTDMSASLFLRELFTVSYFNTNINRYRCSFNSQMVRRLVFINVVIVIYDLRRIPCWNLYIDGKLAQVATWNLGLSCDCRNISSHVVELWWGKYSKWFYSTQLQYLYTLECWHMEGYVYSKIFLYVCTSISVRPFIPQLSHDVHFGAHKCNILFH